MSEDDLQLYYRMFREIVREMTIREKCLLCGVGLALRYDSGEHDPTAQAHQKCLTDLLYGNIKQKLQLLHHDRINKTRIFYNKQEIMVHKFELKMESMELPLLVATIPILELDIERDGEYTKITIVDEYNE